MSLVPVFNVAAKYREQKSGLEAFAPLGKGKRQENRRRKEFLLS